MDLLLTIILVELFVGTKWSNTMTYCTEIFKTESHVSNEKTRKFSARFARLSIDNENVFLFLHVADTGIIID